MAKRNPHDENSHSNVTLFGPHVSAAAQQIAELNHQLAQTTALLKRLEARLDERLPPIETPAPPATPAWTPCRSEWATYDGFRRDMQAREIDAAQFTDDLTKNYLAGGVGCHPRTITRTMHHYHLPSRLWPPSRWPAQQPALAHVVGMTGHGFASLAASMVFLWVIRDVLSDGRFDATVRGACWFLHHIQGLPV